VLDRVEPAGLIMSRQALDALAAEFAEIINDSMIDLGFLWHDDIFMIEPWFVESPTYATAVVATRADALTTVQRLRTRWARRPVLGGLISG